MPVLSISVSLLYLSILLPFCWLQTLLIHFYNILRACYALLRLRIIYYLILLFEVANKDTTMNKPRKLILDLDLLSANENRKAIQMSLIPFFSPKKTLLSVVLIYVCLFHSIVFDIRLCAYMRRPVCVWFGACACVCLEYMRTDVTWWLILSLFTPLSVDSLK